MADVEVLDAAAAQRVREGLYSAAQTLTMVGVHCSAQKGRLSTGEERRRKERSAAETVKSFVVFPLPASH
jgi:hypothetical protein